MNSSKRPPQKSWWLSLAAILRLPSILRNLICPLALIWPYALRLVSRRFIVYVSRTPRIEARVKPNGGAS
jgi:hypothetical protein